MSRRAVFLDRDGTVIKDKHYLSDPEGVELFPGVPRALRDLRDEGYQLVIVTNQSGVGRGYMTEADVEAVHDRLRDRLGEEGINLTDIYYAPYHEDADDPQYRRNRYDRKPRPGMIETAVDEHEIDAGNSYMIGDKESDLVAGRRAGCASILVRTANGPETAQSIDPGTVDYVADGLTDATRYILDEAE